MRPRSTLFIVTLLACAACEVFAQQPAAQPDQPPAARTTAPLPNRANELMPSWLHLRGEFRERFEGFAHAGFTPRRDDAYWLSRLRINAVLAPGRLVSATVQLQDARVAQKQVAPVAPP